MANTLYSTVKSKYDLYQKGRGYKGTVKSKKSSYVKEIYSFRVFTLSWEIFKIQMIKSDLP